MLTALLTIYALGAGLMFLVIKAEERAEHKKCPFFKGFLIVTAWPFFVGAYLWYWIEEAGAHDSSDL
jgi:hypothetical protein